MPDITKTRAQLVERVADNLNLLQAGQTIETDVYAKIDSHLDEAVSAMAALGIVYIADLEEIETAVFSDSAKVIAFRIASSGYGIPPREQDAQLSELRLRQMTSGKPTFETQRAEYF